jgi:hypothetical protein
MYTVYKTINLVNNKFYYGVHKTNTPDDEYLGSGKLIKLAVNKYGRENFHKTIIEVFDDSKSAFELEEKLVSEFKDNSLCYNLKEGGNGGFDYINENLPYASHKLTLEQVAEIRWKAEKENKLTKELSNEYGVCTNTINDILRGNNWLEVTNGNPLLIPKRRSPKRGTYSELHKSKISLARKKWFESNSDAKNALAERMGDYWKGKPKTLKQKEKIAQSNRERQNPILGRIWMNNGVINRLIKPDEIEQFTLNNWQKGRL